MARLLDRAFQQDTVNFLLTNRIPRKLATRFVGWFSRIENPLVCRLSIAVWTLFAGGLRLDEAQQATFTSLHDCFIRELKPGVRPIAASRDVLVSPCDAIVGAAGAIRGHELLQAKDSRYALHDLLAVDRNTAERFIGGRYVTLRLTSTMYHRFHAPADCEVCEATYVSGDTWNVNPPALKRIARLYCKNERAVIRARLDDGGAEIAMVAVGAILVASIHLHFVDVPLTVTFDGRHRFYSRAAFRKGDELGYFHHGSTIVVVAPAGFELCANVREGESIRMGEPLLRAMSMPKTGNGHVSRDMAGSGGSFLR
jgi:phosphatidylserine decarboxylase